MLRYDTLLKRNPANPIISPMDFPYGQNISQRIEVKEGIPVTITTKAVLPDEVK